MSVVTRPFDITSPGISTSNNCIFTNAGLPPGATGSGNIFSQTANTIFVNELNNTYEFSDDARARWTPGANAFRW
ncbi:MAG: hypothetical protein IPG74_02740 [Flavobacteriales bacterium]|nr:hypothetical protein [Flavobacteriales bacterium]